MDAKQKAKLERYFKNSSRFLWGLGPGNQKKTYMWLHAKGYEFDNGPYAHVTIQLLDNPGIEKVLKDLVIPRVYEKFNAGAIDALRNCWNTGMMPNMSFLRTYKMNDPYPFLEVNRQFNYVERWGEFAGLWFEEIEPLIKALET